MAADKVVLAGEVRTAKDGSGSAATGLGAGRAAFLGDAALSVFLGEEARSVFASFRDGDVGSGLGLFVEVVAVVVDFAAAAFEESINIATTTGLFKKNGGKE